LIHFLDIEEGRGLDRSGKSGYTSLRDIGAAVLRVKEMIYVG
jgi:hypothetical protein